MVSIEDLARQIAEKHNIDTHAAAVAVVAAHIDAIADDPDLWTGEELTDAGAKVVAGAVSESYRLGLVATKASMLLEELGDVAREIRDAEERARMLVARRDGLIRTALATELRRGDIAQAAGLNPSRLYQIRDAAHCTEAS